MKEIVMEIITVALPIILGYIVWLLKQQKKDRSANSKGTMLLLRGQLKAYHKEYMQRGWITSEELADYLEMYDAYHSLGGNGVATKWQEDIKGLEVRD
jgi:hypothetical protein